MCSIRQNERPWRFKSGAVFERLDSFRARLHALQDMFQSAAAFGRLERIEIGGYQVWFRSLYGEGIGEEIALTHMIALGMGVVSGHIENHVSLHAFQYYFMGMGFVTPHMCLSCWRSAISI